MFKIVHFGVLRGRKRLWKIGPINMAALSAPSLSIHPLCHHLRLPSLLGGLWWLLALDYSIE